MKLSIIVSSDEDEDEPNDDMTPSEHLAAMLDTLKTSITENRLQQLTADDVTSWLMRFSHVQTQLLELDIAILQCDRKSQSDDTFVGSGRFGSVRLVKSRSVKIINCSKLVEREISQYKHTLTNSSLDKIYISVNNIFQYCGRVRTALNAALKLHPLKFPTMYGCTTCLSDGVQIVVELDYIQGDTLVSIYSDLNTTSRYRLENDISMTLDNLNKHNIFHNDVHPGNIIVSQDRMRYYFIDLDMMTVNKKSLNGATDAWQFTHRMSDIFGPDRFTNKKRTRGSK